jgi:hypothetical protein
LALGKVTRRARSRRIFRTKFTEVSMAGCRSLRLLLDRPRRREAAKIQLNSLAANADKTYRFQRGWGVMSKFERMLEAGSTEPPDCRCAAEMNLMAIVPMDGGDSEIRIFRCPACSHELRLTAWRNDATT